MTAQTEFAMMIVAMIPGLVLGVLIGTAWNPLSRLTDRLMPLVDAHVKIKAKRISDKYEQELRDSQPIGD